MHVLHRWSRTLSLAGAATLLSLAPRLAHASTDEPPDDGTLLLALGVTAIDAGFLVYDVLDGVGVTDGGTTYGWVESAIAAPQLALGIVWLASPDEETALGAWTVAISSVMLAHGIHEILRPEQQRRDGVTLAPVPTAGGGMFVLGATF